jgi:hypothetical protein
VGRALLPATAAPAAGLWSASATNRDNLISLFNLFNSFQIIATTYKHFQSLTKILHLEAILSPSTW